MTDRQTDRQRDILRRHSPRYAYASRGKNDARTGLRLQRLRAWWLFTPCYGALAKWTKYRRARAYCFAQRHVVCLYICPERYTLPKASYFGRLVCHALHIFLFYVCRLSSVMVQVGSGSLVDSVELVTLNLKRNFTQQLSSLVLSWACFDYPFNEHN